MVCDLVYDLHCHSNASDGTLSPLQLVDAAVAKGVQLLALTDHDTVAGVKQLYASEHTLRDIQLVPGVEFTCKFEKQVLHVVALGLDIHSERLAKHLTLLDQLRFERAERIAYKLTKKKLPDVLPAVLKRVDGGQIARPHFAKVLCDLGIVRSQGEAFDKYLGKGKVGDVSVEWPELESLLSLINACGGVSVLAHPTKYRLKINKVRKLLACFKALGGDAVEISYPGITPEQQAIIKYEALEHGLFVSAGSDFHDPEYKWTELGRFPQVPEGVPHILTKIYN